VRRVRSAAAAAGLSIDVEVDGGIDEHTVVEAARSGANVFVSGSAVFCRPHPLEAAAEILAAAVGAVKGEPS
jgi:ribulose-phosphate 3-epimerase